MKWTDQIYSADEAQEIKINSKGKRAGIIAIYIFLFLLVVPLFLLASGWIVDGMIGVQMQGQPLTTVSGAVLLISGAFLMGGAMLQLIRHGNGLPISHLPPENLVDHGLYQYIRHPIYSGFLALAAGVALVIPSIGMLTVSLPLLLLGMICYVRFYEEPALNKRYGPAYEKYVETTPALFPSVLSVTRSAWYKVAKKRFYAWINRIANHTVLFRYGDAIFVSYGLLCALGITLFMQHVAVSLLAQGMSAYEAGIFIAGCGLAGVTGARVYWWLEHIRSLIHEPWWGLKKVGFVSWGVPIGLLAFTVPFALLNSYSLLLLSDVLFAGMFIGYSLGRIGCLTYGCCYGKLCNEPGIVYRNDYAKVNRLKHTHGSTRFPTQLFSAAHGLLLILLLNAILYAEPRAGVLTVFALLYYGMGRFYEEFYRDRDRVADTIFTEGHVGSVAFILIGLLLALGIQQFNVPVLQAWTMESVRESLVILPLVGLMGVLMFLILGYHHKELGRW
ncbi:hypothetical protein G3570_00255 [Balneolaceae bacterium YR4-1]|uniref:Prolipoprotein diacylglyceryl transferase n=1 Tax=Halalkalibaculum roseum TaxID=2709311 RepID=A0A6M1SYW8_9BACT|nr:prolipoprotein diacylglyceryl transferase family protein [Halalkalibaculum roseum]NGP75045.1 hypothetical protein [Halalkalibaculum roseum]